MNVQMYLYTRSDDDADITEMSVEPSRCDKSIAVKFNQKISTYDKNNRWAYISDEITVWLNHDQLVDLRTKIDVVLSTALIEAATEDRETVSEVEADKESEAEIPNEFGSVTAILGN